MKTKGTMATIGVFALMLTGPAHAGSLSDLARQAQEEQRQAEAEAKAQRDSDYNVIQARNTALRQNRAGSYSVASVTVDFIIRNYINHVEELVNKLDSGIASGTMGSIDRAADIRACTDAAQTVIPGYNCYSHSGDVSYEGGRYTIRNRQVVLGQAPVDELSISFTNLRAESSMLTVTSGGYHITFRLDQLRPGAFVLRDLTEGYHYGAAVVNVEVPVSIQSMMETMMETSGERITIAKTVKRFDAIFQYWSKDAASENRSALDFARLVLTDPVRLEDLIKGYYRLAHQSHR